MRPTTASASTSRGLIRHVALILGLAVQRLRIQLVAVEARALFLRLLAGAGALGDKILAQMQQSSLKLIDLALRRS